MFLVRIREQTFWGSVLGKAIACLYSLLLFVSGFNISENRKSRPWSLHTYYLSELTITLS